MSLKEKFKNNTIVSRVLFGASALGIIGLVGVASASAQSISNTGPHSHNSITVTHNKTTSITKSTTISDVTTNSQTSSSGKAEVKDNTTGGSATSGSSTNAFSNEVTITVTN